MLGNGAFSKEEAERLIAAPHIMADFLKRSAELGWTVAAEQIRSTYWEIETYATRLRRMAKGWAPGQTRDEVAMSMEARQLLEGAADELDRLARLSVRRPISELRQEAFKGRPSGPDRWVVLWGPSGYRRAPHWRCHIGRRDPQSGKHAGLFVTHDGELFTNDGPAATHFSELPDDEA
jgi:hypothetical protein